MGETCGQASTATRPVAGRQRGAHPNGAGRRNDEAAGGAQARPHRSHGRPYPTAPNIDRQVTHPNRGGHGARRWVIRDRATRGPRGRTTPMCAAPSTPVTTRPPQPSSSNATATKSSAFSVAACATPPMRPRSSRCSPRISGAAFCELHPGRARPRPSSFPQDADHNATVGLGQRYISYQKRESTYSNLWQRRRARTRRGPSLRSADAAGHLDLRVRLASTGNRSGSDAGGAGAAHESNR